MASANTSRAPGNSDSSTLSSLRAMTTSPTIWLSNPRIGWASTW